MTTGRRAGYKIMKNANKYLCIDIGGTAIKYGIFTDETECLMKNQYNYASVHAGIYCMYGGYLQYGTEKI